MSKNFKDSDNIEKIRQLNSLMLDEAHEVIVHGLPLDNRVEVGHEPKDSERTGIKGTSIADNDLHAERKVRRNLIDRIWGIKTPLYKMLESIAGVEVALEKHRPTPKEDEQPAMRIVWDESDILLVQDFVSKHRLPQIEESRGRV